MLKKDIVHEEHRVDIYKQLINECKKHGLNPASRMRAVPHIFGQGGEINLLQYAKSLLEDNRQLVKINESQCPKLVTSLRSATAENMKLDKENTNYDDVLFFYTSTIFLQIQIAKPSQLFNTCIPITKEPLKDYSIMILQRF